MFLYLFVHICKYMCASVCVHVCELFISTLFSTSCFCTNSPIACSTQRERECAQKCPHYMPSKSLGMCLIDSINSRISRGLICHAAVFQRADPRVPDHHTSFWGTEEFRKFLRCPFLCHGGRREPVATQAGASSSQVELTPPGRLLVSMGAGLETKQGLRAEGRSILGGVSRALGYGGAWLQSTALGAARIARGNEEVKKRGQAWSLRVL